APAGPLTGPAADVGSIYFNRPAERTERAIMPHGFADAMIHKPRRLLGDAALAGYLMRADTFLATRHQVHGHQPLVNRNLALFHDGADAHRELFSATTALVHAGTERAFRSFLLGQLGDFVALAVRSYATVRRASRVAEVAGLIA